MNVDGDVLVVEDDEDDRYILNLVFQHLNYPNKVVFVNNGIEALNYLNNNQDEPFIVLSDINMPLMDGFELRDKILQNNVLTKKNIPYLYLTTSSEREQVTLGYQKSIQGYFVKKSGFNEYIKMVKEIMEYWKTSMQPQYDMC